MKNAPVNILVFVDWYYPGYQAGGPIRSVYNLVNQLKGDFKFSIFTRNTDYLETKPYEDIVSDQWIEVSENVRVYYASPKQLSGKLISRIVEENHYEVIYLNSMFSKYFSIVPLQKINRRSGVKIILAPRGMLGEGSLRIRKLKKLLFLKLSRVLGLYNGVVFHSTSVDEKNDIDEHFGKNTPIEFAPNLPGQFHGGRVVGSKVKESGRLKLVSVARIAPEKNLNYALELLKEVSGQVELNIYGSIYDHGYWKKCSGTIKSLPENIRVHKHEGVPHQELYSILGKHHFLILPSPGENFGHIIFEALSSGCPPIISDNTPWKELQKQSAGWSIPLNDKNSWVSALNECVNMDQSRYDLISVATEEYAAKYLMETESLELTRKMFAIE